MIDENALKKIAIDKGTTLEGIAIACGINRTTLYRRMKSDSLLVRDIHAICDYLRLSGEEAMNIFLPFCRS